MTVMHVYWQTRRHYETCCATLSWRNKQGVWNSRVHMVEWCSAQSQLYIPMIRESNSSKWFTFSVYKKTFPPLFPIYTLQNTIHRIVCIMQAGFRGWGNSVCIYFPVFFLKMSLNRSKECIHEIISQPLRVKKTIKLNSKLKRNTEEFTRKTWKYGPQCSQLPLVAWYNNKKNQTINVLIN